MSARDITLSLGGKWCGRYGTARCPVHDDKNPSLSIADGDNGDIVVRCFAGCDWRDIKSALRERGLLPEWKGEAVPVDPSVIEKRRLEQEREQQGRIDSARKIWREARDPAGSPVEVYLKGRGITILPPSIRYTDLTHGPTNLVLPAMVCAVQGPDGQVQGVHRTFLRADGKIKAPLTQNKMMLGVCGGGAVRLGKGGDRLGIGEGIETCLSVAQECPDLPVWAALSTSGLKAVEIPPSVKEIIILADNDPPGEEAAQAAAVRLLREGRESVKIARPTLGDFNADLTAPDNILAFPRSRAHA